MARRSAPALIWILAFGTGVHAQSRAEAGTSAERTLIEGSVFDADGNVASGAVVVSSAGGHAVVDSSGRFHLAVDLAPEIERVQITAVGGDAGNQVGHLDVAVDARGNPRVDSLQLVVGRGCVPRWLPTFDPLPGVGGIPFSVTVHALAVFDDGNGPQLYAGGTFSRAGSLEEDYLARWDGTSWSGVGGGPNEVVLSLSVFEDASGPALFVGGLFSRAGGIAARGAARWDGTTWSSVGNGPDEWTQFLGVFDDGTVPALYAYRTDGALLRFDGAHWDTIGSGFDGLVRAVEFYDDGSGRALYAGGDFTNVAGIPAKHLARWDGTSWSDAGDFRFQSVRSLRTFDDGNGEALFVGGEFEYPLVLAFRNLARWEGAGWTFDLAGRDVPIFAMTIHDDGSGPTLFTSNAKWDGASWVSLDISYVLAMAPFDDGRGLALFAGGTFGTGGNVSLHQLGRWDGSRWAPISEGLDQAVEALAIHDDGSGAALYAGGSFRAPAGGEAQCIARWAGGTWEPLGGGLNGTVLALESFDDGSGMALYAGGHFTAAGVVGVSHVAKWDGASWSPLDSGLDGAVRALEVWDDGSGPALYAGGDFTSAGAVSANRIARWDGASWSPLAGGLSGTATPRVRALRFHHDGSGTSLYVGGEFTSAGTRNAVNIARWDGAGWFKLGTSMNGNGIASPVHALEGFDDGGGPALFVGTTDSLARWNGSWTHLTSDPIGVRALRVFDDGRGPALHVGGSFISIAGLAASNVARWDGASWSPLGSGVSSAVGALARFQGTLFVGGTFETSPASDAFLARWGCKPLRVR